MSFDKSKAMKNAERFLAQGKIKAAISEYKSIIESDPTDYNTMNMLGDLYVKASEETEAVNCFTQIAEHYTKQGFSQKAIAIYNKISRLKPDSLEVSSKLAQLYQSKGSIAEAKSHYNMMAEQYAKVGKKAEALMVWKQIANLDPSNTEIYLKIADACWKENQKNEAAQAYIEAGSRLVIKKQFESAITAYSRALEIKPEDLLAMRGMIDAQISLGYVDEAAKILEDAIEKQPYNRELVYLLIDCYLGMGKLQEAEIMTVRLVEQEPSNYPKLLDLVKAYLKDSDYNSAVRPLTMASEHLLVNGQAVKLDGYVNEILALNPDQIDAIRLSVRYHTWQRDEAKIQSSYERLAEVARTTELVEDEMHALAQLIMILPQNTYYAQRLHELKAANGDFSINSSEVPTFESFQNLGDEDAVLTKSQSDISEFDPYLNTSNGNGNGNYGEVVGENGFSHEFKFEDEENASEIVDESAITEIDDSDHSGEIYSSVKEEFDEFIAPSPIKLSEFEKHNLQKEIEGIDFYLAQGFGDLAEKALNEIEERFGSQPEITEARKSLFGGNRVVEAVVEEPQAEIVETVAEPLVEAVEFEDVTETIQSEQNLENDAFVEVQNPETEINNLSGNMLEDIKSEFGIDDKPQAADEPGDFETPYQTGIVYKEMGLLEESIREFQNAIKITSPDDGTKRFYWCCNMLGHCFLEKQMPNLALMWFKRALESKNLSVEELQGLHYEIADSHEQGGDLKQAIETFEKIYAFDVSYRDVGERIAKLKSK